MKVTIEELYEWAMTNDILDYKIYVGISVFAQHLLMDDDIVFDDERKCIYLE